MIRPLAILVFTALVAQADGFTADSARGRELFDTLSCVQCHSVNGKGGSMGPDLGRILDRGFTPATLAATMWNHAPAMWAAMRQRDIRPGDLDEQAAADLFAFFYSVRFFELPGDAARGKRAFTALDCSNCHGLQRGILATAKPVRQWDSLADPIALTEAMWNHAPLMLAEARLKHELWPALTAQELTDILVYLRNLPFVSSTPTAFQIGTGPDGESVFRAKGCGACHRSGGELSKGIRGKTLTDIAASMWNHQPVLSRASATPARFAPDEMRAVIGYLWARQFFETAGSPSAGRRVFVSKRCSSCHQDFTTLAGESLNGASMVSVLWRHGPRMLDQMKSRHIAWPRFERAQMSDLIAFLNSASGRTQ